MPASEEMWQLDPGAAAALEAEERLHPTAMVDDAPRPHRSGWRPANIPIIIAPTRPGPTSYSTAYSSATSLQLRGYREPR